MAAEEQKAKRFGEFLVEKVICDGPKATVYKAKKDGAACALKILKDTALPKSRGHRKKLAQVLRRLNMIDHPAVVKVIDGGERGGRLYIAMELMDCPTLEQLLKAEGSFPERDVVMIGRRIAQALAAGEAVSICHGDVTLRNIFAPERDEAKLADFAVNKYLQEMPSDAVVGQSAQAGPREARPGAGGRSAEDVLRSRSTKDFHEGLRDDLTALSAVMLSLFGLSVPPREAGENLDSYCDRLRRLALDLVKPPYSVSAHTRNVIDRLLSPEEFKSAGQAVAELASAVLLHRTSHAAPPPAEGDGATPTTGQAQTLREPVAAPPKPAAGEHAPQAKDLAGAAEKAVEQAAGEPKVAEHAARPGVVLLWRDQDRGEFFVLSEGSQLVIGRDPYTCDLVIAESAASRKHCTLTARGNRLQMVDTSSYHGTYVNGVRVERADLAVGDIIRIGGTKITIGASLPAR